MHVIVGLKTQKTLKGCVCGEEISQEILKGIRAANRYSSTEQKQNKSLHKKKTPTKIRISQHHLQLETFFKLTSVKLLLQILPTQRF